MHYKEVIMYNIGILTSCESERHLSLHVHKELYNIGCKPYIITIEQNNITSSYEKTHILIHKLKLDFLLSVGDRPEQVGGVLAAFHNKIPIGHLYAGDHNTISNEITTFDDIHRHVISLYANIQFCSCKESMDNVISLMNSVGLTPNAHNVGATHFDGVNLEEIRASKFLRLHIPSHAYILILINSETSGNDDQLIKDTISTALGYGSTHSFVILSGNGDSATIPLKLRHELISLRTKTEKYLVTTFGNPDHEHFLSLIMHCSKFITNSSCVTYEAPALMNIDNIVRIGNRNINRTVIPSSSHSGKASKKVSCLIKEYCNNIQS